MLSDTGMSATGPTRRWRRWTTGASARTAGSCQAEDTLHQLGPHVCQSQRRKTTHEEGEEALKAGTAVLPLVGEAEAVLLVLRAMLRSRPLLLPLLMPLLDCEAQAGAQASSCLWALWMARLPLLLP